MASWSICKRAVSHAVRRNSAATTLADLAQGSRRQRLRSPPVHAKEHAVHRRLGRGGLVVGPAFRRRQPCSCLASAPICGYRGIGATSLDLDRMPTLTLQAGRLIRAGVALLVVALPLACATTDLATLRRGIPLSDAREIRVRAVFRGAQACLPCPTTDGTEALCQPCVSMVLLAETPDGPEADVLWVAGAAGQVEPARTHARPRC